MVVLTGGTGFVGSCVAKRLAALGIPIRAIVRRPGESPELQGPGIVEIRGDFVDPAAAGPAAKGADIVVHCAAAGGPDLDPVRRVNTEGTRTMVEAALAGGCRRFIHISTCSVYDTTGLETVDEDASLKTSGDPYGWTKAEAENLVVAGAKRGLAATILRPGAVLGVHPTSTWAVRMPVRIRDGDDKVTSAPDRLVPCLHVDDLVDAVLLSLDKERSVGRTYNVVDGHFSWRSYLEEIRGWFGLPPLGINPQEETREASPRFDARRIRGELGYAPRRTYEEGMAEAAHHWRTQHEQTRSI